jgi:hypothetical protein
LTPATGSASHGGTQKLQQLAHQSAVGGVSLSVVGIGRETSGEDLDSLALAGQGRRYWLERTSDAPRIVEQELSATSRAVARAVRLRIRLAKGVSLIDVVGSKPLSEIQATRVREAERSIDLRLARNLGIEADRGEDEDGIQIVIPSFYASDSHAILLDVVADGPGAIAEVTARYKDLVRLENTVAKASLSLTREQQTQTRARGRGRGPLETNVLKNFLAHRLSRELEAASDEVRSGRLEVARARLEKFRLLLEGLSYLGEFPQLVRDRETVADVSMLADYVQVLDGDALQQPVVRAYVADSLRYAGARKRLLVPAL